MSIIKCCKLKCEVCGIEDTAQLFYNKAGQLRYARVRHYKGLNQNKKPQFNYHKIEDLETLMKTLNIQFPKPNQNNSKPKLQAKDFSQAHGQLGQVIPGLNLKNKPQGLRAFTLKRC